MHGPFSSSADSPVKGNASVTQAAKRVFDAKTYSIFNGHSSMRCYEKYARKMMPPAFAQSLKCMPILIRYLSIVLHIHCGLIFAHIALSSNSMKLMHDLVDHVMCVWFCIKLLYFKYTLFSMWQKIDRRSEKCLSKFSIPYRNLIWRLCKKSRARWTSIDAHTSFQDQLTRWITFNFHFSVWIILIDMVCVQSSGHTSAMHCGIAHIKKYELNSIAH